jgi:anti-sigma factor RsiW
MPRFTFPWRRRANGTPGLACQELVELVTAYFDGALDAADTARFEQHIAGCDACTTYLEQMRETIALLGTLEPAAVAPEAARELGAAFREWHAGR